MDIDENKVIVIIHKCVGKANSHKHAAAQSSDITEYAAHMSAYNDLKSLAEELTSATSDPKYATSPQALFNAKQKNQRA